MAVERYSFDFFGRLCSKDDSDRDSSDTVVILVGRYWRDWIPVPLRGVLNRPTFRSGGGKNESDVHSALTLLLRLKYASPKVVTLFCSCCLSPSYSIDHIFYATVLHCSGERTKQQSAVHKMKKKKNESKQTLYVEKKRHTRTLPRKYAFMTRQRRQFPPSSKLVVTVFDLFNGAEIVGLQSGFFFLIYPSCIVVVTASTKSVIPLSS